MRLLAALLASIVIIGCTTTPETGRHAFVIIPRKMEMNLGQQAYSEVLKKERETTDARKKEIVERVGRRIASVTTHPEWRWEFKTIESEQANAFCLPGGKVVVYTGLFPHLGNEAALATVLGHETAHAIARHGAQRISQGLVIEGGLEVASIALGNPRTHDAIMAMLGAGANVGLVLPFSRKEESEADEIGLLYMARAGYDPAEAVTFWQRFAKGTGKKPPEILSDHPADEKRVKHMIELQPRAQAEAAKAREKLGAGEPIS